MHVLLHKFQEESLLPRLPRLMAIGMHSHFGDLTLFSNIDVQRSDTGKLVIYYLTHFFFKDKFVSNL